MGAYNTIVDRVTMPGIRGRIRFPGNMLQLITKAMMINSRNLSACQLDIRRPSRISSPCNSRGIYVHRQGVFRIDVEEYHPESNKTKIDSLVLLEHRCAGENIPDP
jgi:hypothetical protein